MKAQNEFPPMPRMPRRILPTLDTRGTYQDLTEELERTQIREGRIAQRVTYRRPPTRERPNRAETR